jgi:hypothetical protein
MDLTQSTVDVYQANINGKASPSSSYPVRASAITGDSLGNIYIAELSTPTATVQVFASGSATASSTLTVSNTLDATQNQILTMTVDHSDFLYVAFANVIYVYAPEATGNAAPVRTITSPPSSKTGFTPSQMAVDSAGDLFVAQSVAPSTVVTYQLVEYPPMANGSASPVVLAATPAYGPTGVAIDSSDNIYISQGAPYCGAPCGTYTAGIVEFAKGATAGATPMRFITGGNTGFGVYASNTFVDAAGNIFVQLTQNGQENFEVFSATENGNVAPASVLLRSVGATTDSQSYIH